MRVEGLEQDSDEQQEGLERKIGPVQELTMMKTLEDRNGESTTA